jgi:hypothetical protein
LKWLMSQVKDAACERRSRIIREEEGRGNEQMEMSGHWSRKKAKRKRGEGVIPRRSGLFKQKAEADTFKTLDIYFAALTSTPPMTM